MSLSARIELQREYARTGQQRRLLVFSGERSWCRQQVAQLELSKHTIWLGKQGPDSVEQLDPRQAQRLLGRTISQLVIDSWDGLNPNGLGQAAGALTGGGLLIILCPALEQWPQYDDPEHRAMAVEPYCTNQVGRRFIQRLVRLIRKDPFALVIEESGAVTQPRAAAVSERAVNTLDQAKIVSTLDQQRAVQAILHTARNRRQPLVITADRGRGKSAALGIAAAQLLQQGGRVLVTAPQYPATHEVFQFARKLLPDARTSAGELEWGEGSLNYLEPEQLLKTEAEGCVLLVDEAAAIPAPMLAAILERFNRIVFATTVHGYEGTGRGFSVRFRHRLDQRTPRWRSINLSQPIRWAENDPVEKLVFEALLLDADAASDTEVMQSNCADVSCEVLDRDQLAMDEPLLRQLFGLLVLAHYRTTPGDLRLLLDSPNMRIWCIREAGLVLACALVADEGPLERTLAEAVWAGARRPPGHLLPQTLIAQAGFVSAADQLCARVMRVAVHPVLRRQRLGEKLLQAIADDAQLRGLDYVGASFAATADLMPFWQQCGFQPVRLGLTRDAVSGAHAVLVIHPLSSSGAQLFRALRQRYSEQIPHLIYSELAGIERELMPRLLWDIELPVPLNGQDLNDLRGFSQHNRALENTRYALRKLALQLFSNGCVPEDDRYQALLIEQLLAPGVLPVQQAGRKWLHQQLRELVAECLFLLEANSADCNE